MKKSLSIARIGFQQMICDPMYIVFTLAMPLMMTWAMSFLPEAEGVYEMASLGVLVMFVALNLITSASAVIEERQTGTWQRILTSPVAYREIMGGYFIKLFIVAMVQALILLLSGKFLFGAPWNTGYGQLMVVLVVYIFAMTGLGLFLASFLKTQAQVQAVATGIVMAGTTLGGVFFPLENPSGILKLIATISPQSWAAHALRDILTVGVSMASLATPLLWMGAIGSLMLAVGTLRIRMEG